METHVYENNKCAEEIQSITVPAQDKFFQTKSQTFSAQALTETFNTIKEDNESSILLANNLVLYT